MRKAAVIILTVFLAGCSVKGSPDLTRQERINSALAQTLNTLIASHNKLSERVQALEPAKK